MSETTSITAVKREASGKANRRMAPLGQIPAVLYGATMEASPLALDRHAFEQMMIHHGAGSTLVSIDIEGEKKPVNAIVKEIQRSPVKGTILHVDFQAIRMDQKLQATTSLSFVGDSEGVKAGGVFMQAMREVNVEALPADLTDYIEIDISGLEIGDSLTVADLTAPAGVELLDDPETVVCSVTAPSLEPTEEEEMAAEEMEARIQPGESVISVSVNIVYAID